MRSEPRPMPHPASSTRIGEPGVDPAPISALRSSSANETSTPCPRDQRRGPRRSDPTPAGPPRTPSVSHRAEHRRIVGVQRHHHARVPQPKERMRLERGVDAGGHVGDRGETSSGIRRSASVSTSRGSSIARTPCPMRSGGSARASPTRSRALPTRPRAAPSAGRPPWLRRTDGANGRDRRCARCRRSSAPTTPRPANFRATSSVRRRRVHPERRAPRRA